MEQNDFFYKRLKCTKNEYKKITSNLSEKELNLIKKINQNNESFGELQAQNLFIKLKNILLKERSKIEETIYIFFDGYPKEDVDAVIKDLNEYDKNILFLRYGKDLEHPVRSENWTEEHRNYFFNELIPRMKTKLETLHITPVKVKHVFKKPVPMDEQKNRIKSPKKEEKPNKGTSLYAMYPEIKKEDLKLIVYHLDSTKKRALYLRHSETLNSYKYLSLIDFRKIEAKYNEAIVLLDKIALKYKKTLKEQIQFDEKNLELLNQDEKKALEIIHGENHDKTLPTFVLNKTEKESYAKALKLLKNGLQQVKSPKEEIITDKHLKKELPKKTCQSVEEVQEKSCEKIKSPSKISSKKSKKETKLIQNKFPDKTLEEIREAVKKLTKKQQEAIYARHGQDLDTYNEWSKEETKKYRGNYCNGIKILNSMLYEKNQTKEETKLIQNKFPDKTLEEIKEAVKRLTKKQQEAIYARHGQELDTYNEWSKEETKRYVFNYCSGIKILNSMLYENKQSKKEEKLIKNKFPDKTLEEIKEAVKRLTKKQQDAIYARHGKDLDTYNEWSKEETKKYFGNYRYAIKNLNSILYENKERKKSLIERYSKIEVKQLRELVMLLHKIQQEAIYARHGQDLDTYNEWSKEKYAFNYYNAIKHIDEIIFYLTTPILKIFEEKENVVSNIIESLDDDFKIVIKKFCEEKYKMNTLSLEEKKIYLRSLKKIYKLLQNRKNYEGLASRKSNNEEKKRTKLKSIYKVYSNYSKSQINDAISCLTEEEKDIFDLRNGKDYENPSSSLTTKEQKQKYNQIVYKIGEILVLNNQTLFEYYSFYSKKEIEDAISRLELRLKDDLKLLYGLDYCHPIGYKKMMELSLKASRKEILHMLSIELSNSKYYIDYNKIYKLYDCFDKEILDDIIQSLKKAYKNILVLNEKDMLDEKDKQILDMKVIPEIETRLNNVKPKKDKENNIKDISKKTYQYITEVPKRKNEVKQEENTSVIFEGKSEWINLSINDSGELIHFNINYNGSITKENKRTLEIMIETALKEALHKMKFSSERIKPNGLQEEFLDKATGEIKEEVEKSEKLFHSDQNEYVKAYKVPTVSKKKLNTKKKEQPISVSKAKKDPLKEEKQKLKVRLYDKYFPVYKDFITPKEMEIIIDESVNSYQIEENINMETSSVFKIESAIYMLLSKKYCENIDNEIGLNISLFVEEFYGNKIKNRCANFSQGDISEALLKTLETYDGEKTFFIETILYLKKKSN